MAMAGEVAIVTGGSGGIGRDVAAALAAAGCRVVVTYSSSPDKAQQLVTRLQSKHGSGCGLAFKCDVSVESQVQALFDAAEAEMGKVSLLINCAGVRPSSYPSIQQTSAAEWDWVLGVNARGTFLTCREATSRLRDGGRIINFSSSTVGSHPLGFGAYIASKAAVEALSKLLAKELGPRKITVNVVAPGAVAGEMFSAGKTEETIQRFRAACPLGRLGESGDVVPVVLFLLSKEAGWVNGQVLRLNGGEC